MFTVVCNGPSLRFWLMTTLLPDKLISWIDAVWVTLLLVAFGFFGVRFFSQGV